MRLPTLLAFALLSATAAAQTPGSFVGKSTNANAPPLTADALNAAFGRKVDVTGGVLANPSITGVMAITGNLTVTGTITGAGASFLPLSGGTLSGAMAGTSAIFSGGFTGTSGFTAGSNSFAGVPLQINGAVSQTRQIRWQTAGLMRSAMGLSTEAESGSNVGANPGINLYDDTGTLIHGGAWKMIRATGGMLLNTTYSAAITGTSVGLHNIAISEAVDASGTTNNTLFGMGWLHNYGGTTTKGGRVGLNLTLVQQNGANADTGQDNFYVGAATYAFARFAQPGSSTTTPLGRVFGFNANGQIQRGFAATNYYQVASAEFNVGISLGSTAALRSGVTIADLDGESQGYWTDNMLWLYGGGSSGAAKWRYGINFSDSQAWPIDDTVGTMMGAKYGGGRNAPPDMSAMWGIDLQQVAFPGTGNSYDGGSFRSNNWAVDGTGRMQIGSTYLTPSSTGFAIDVKGSIGTSAAISTAGSGYEAGFIVVQAYGGLWSIPTVAGVPTGAVTQLVAPVAPTTTPPANPVTVTNLNKGSVGSGLTLTITWNTTATALSIQPTAGGKLAFNGATPIVKATPAGACAGNTGCQALRDALGNLGLINTGSITN